jgi:FlaA1/EpsC-like NDP-sugar epimerase
MAETMKSVPISGLRIRYLVAIDIGSIVLAFVLSFVIRYEALVDVWPYLRLGMPLLSVIILIRLPVYYGFGLYNRLWRYASMKEMRTILFAGAVASILIYVANFWVMPFLGIRTIPSHSIWLLEGVLSTGFLGGTRMLLRILQERMQPGELARLRTFVQNPSRVLIVGAGDAGAMTLREMQANPGLGFRAVGFVDDQTAKHHMYIHGVCVLGGRHDIPKIVSQKRVDQVIIAMPTASGKQIRAIVKICEQAGIHPRTIPGIYELLNGTVGLNQLRDVDIEDLLRRAPIRTDTAAVYGLLRGKRVLITGGGGSIGSELCRQILRCHPKEMILLGHGENSIFDTYHELRLQLAREQKDGTASETQTVIRPIIADVRFPERVHDIFNETKPEVVFHAAAHKHVPLMEANPSEAITNNVLGARNLLAAAQAVNVKRFVMISTDKAVNPTSIMGASKRAAELLVHKAATESGNNYVAVRFGNVLGSRGSVVLTFKKQIAAGGPVTVTDPEMERYFMTIPEAVQLVLQAAVLGQGGEVFVLNMGKPVKIVDLAQDLIELSGLEVGRDIDIVFSGVRPGEKLYEELFIDGEDYQRTRHEKIFIAANASSFVPHRLDEAVDALAFAAQSNDRAAIMRGLKNLIPEFQSPQEEPVGELPSHAPKLQPSLEAQPQ